MEQIIEPTLDFDFSHFVLGPPTALSGNNYFTRLVNGENNKHVFVQTPKSLMKQGIVKSGKKMYCDLMFSNMDTIFIQWVENLESTCQHLIYEKKDKWFEMSLEKCDIENAFTSPIRVYKSGKYYTIRVQIKPNVKIFAENGSTIKPNDGLAADSTIISILEFQGVKFSSKSFQIEVEMKQCMVVSPDPFTEKCFIMGAKIGDNTKHILEKDLEKDNTNGNSGDLNLIEKNIKDTDIEKTKIDTEEKDTEEKDTEEKDTEEKDTEEKDTEELEENIEKNIPLNITNKELEDIFREEETTKDETETKETKETKETNVSLNISDKDIYNILKEPTSKDAHAHVKNSSDIIHLEELDLDLCNGLENVMDMDESNYLEEMVLKQPEHIYRDLFEKQLKMIHEKERELIDAVLKIKEIKKTYMLDDCEIDIDVEVLKYVLQQ